MGMQIDATIMENSMESPLKTKYRTAIWSSIPLHSIYLEKSENTKLKRYMHPNVHKSTIYNSQDMEATQVPINRWLD